MQLRVLLIALAGSLTLSVCGASVEKTAGDLNPLKRFINLLLKEEQGKAYTESEEATENR